MPEPYNLTGFTGATDLVQLGSAANTTSSGMFGGLFVLAIFAVLFIMFKAYEDKRAFMGAAFITALITVLLRVIGWTTDVFMFGSFLIAAIAFIIMMWA